MKNIIKALIAASVITVGLLASLPVHATGSTDCTAIPDPYSGETAQMTKYFSVTLDRKGDTGTATFTRKGDKPLCADQAMILESFNMGPNWNGEPDSMESFLSSLPQTMAYATHFTFGKNDTSKTVTVQTPAACYGTQLDAYVGDKEVTTINEKYDGSTQEIWGRIFLPTGTCETPKKVDVCDSKTGNIISVPEADKSKYDIVTSDKCKVEVCDTTDGSIKLVPKTSANTYEDKSSDKCAKIQVCIKDSGVTTLQTITKDTFDSSKHSTDTTACAKPTTPSTPTPSTPEVPAVLPSTGPGVITGSLLGLGALVYGIYSYLHSRRALQTMHIR